MNHAGNFHFHRRGRCGWEAFKNSLVTSRASVSGTSNPLTPTEGNPATGKARRFPERSFGERLSLLATKWQRAGKIWIRFEELFGFGPVVWIATVGRVTTVECARGCSRSTFAN
ncbi:hypothetical protein RB5990 [Rhodopirellula baltica SH 1]|uniref:Uncharacterized protein n=1 Tax=Rhodopirellula baltica (strain DSM 10527 / NCIMB 13988 / SH1) TaxID=243090 RepID=Q7UQZ3_RHOBA|nr:hypothetical protein RB5990 [Rhodopirellula baltica SH 1]